MEIFKQRLTYDNGAIIQQNQIISDEFLVLEEQISNSIDACVDYYNPLTEEYSKEIVIEVIKIRGKKNERKIILRDNAFGMSINPNKDYRIFHSSKRNDSRTVGMHGMALFSVLNLCNDIQIETKHRTGNYFRFGFTPKTFRVSNKKSPEIEIQKIKAHRNDLSSGTTITLTKFKKGVFEDIDLRQLKKEFEKHFEHILRRKRITIKLKENDGEAIICQSFRYSDYCDTPYEKTLTKLYRTNSKKYNTEIEYDISKNPVKMFIIASRNRDLKRGLDLVVGGVGVNEISKIDQFRTYKKYAIWSRGNVGGYIDATGVLEVNPTRKDIKKTELSKAFFSTLNKLEPEILEYIESQSAISNSERFQEIECKINEILREYKINKESTERN